MKMTESEKKEIERIQAKIMNTAAIIVGCAITIFAIWVFFIKGPDMTDLFENMQNIPLPILRK